MDQPVEVARREAERQKCLIDVNTALDSAGQFFMMGVKVLLDVANYGSRSLYHLLLIISSIFTVITVLVLAALVPSTVHADGLLVN